MTINVSPNRVLWIMVGISGFLVALHVLVQISRLGFHHGQLDGLYQMFNLEDECNAPTYWSSVEWLIGAVLAYAIGIHAKQHSQPFATHWLMLAALFFLFSTDETVQIHEFLGGVLKKVLHSEKVRPGGYLFYVWVIPGMLFALGVFFAYLRFMLALPRDIGILIFLSGAVYITGAVGFEMLEAPIDEAGGYMNLLYTIYVTCEETLEMLGVCILVYAQLRYIAGLTDAIRVQVTEGAKSA